MNQKFSQNPNGIEIDQNGTKCFTFGNTRIRVVEHFAEHGKQLSQLLAELVLQEARNSKEKTA